MKAIQVRNLTYRYPDGTQALDGIDFHLDQGECVALLGANGSGKTTFVLHLNGLLESEGRIEICGTALNKNTRALIRNKVGLVFQDADEQLFMPTVIDDVTFGPLNQGVPPEIAAARAEQALARVGLDRSVFHKPPYHLSSGEKRRAAIAGVLVMDPEILVLDEPNTSLDPPGQRELTKLLRELPQAKLIVTHDIDLARSLATRAVFFERGRVAGDGPVDEIVRQFNWSSR